MFSSILFVLNINNKDTVDNKKESFDKTTLVWTNICESDKKTISDRNWRQRLWVNTLRGFFFSDRR